MITRTTPYPSFMKVGDYELGSFRPLIYHLAESFIYYLSFSVA